MGLNWHTLLKLFPFGITVGVALLIAGICLSIKSAIVTPTNGTCETSTTYHYENITSLEYSDCQHDIVVNLACKDLIPCSSSSCDREPHLPCSCTIGINVPSLIKGDVVIGYTLDTFNHTIAEYPNFYQSRDDSQLAGNLSNKVSPNCHPYDYDDNNVTIVPCGMLADAMFNDSIYALSYQRTLEAPSTTVPARSFGLLRDDEKKQFQNPNNTILTAAFQNFSKPKNWTKPIWELDTKLTYNNGLRNEPFIVWMLPDLPIRPIWRLDRLAPAVNNISYKDGLPAGNYSVSIVYNYPYSFYPGPRRLTVYREYSVEERNCNPTESANIGLGVAGIVLGLLLLVTTAALMLAHKRTVTNAKSVSQIQPVSSSNGQPTPPEKTAEVHSANEIGISEGKLLTKPPAIREEEELEQIPLKEDTDRRESYL